MTFTRTTTSPRPIRRAGGSGPTDPLGGSRLVVVLRPVPDNIVRLLTDQGLVEIATDETKTVYASAGAEPGGRTEGVSVSHPATRLKALLTPVEAAQALSVGRSTVYELLAAGQLESVRIGRSRRIPATSISRFVDSLTRASQAGGTIDPYRSSGQARDAAVSKSNSDGRVTMARDPRQMRR